MTTKPRTFRTFPLLSLPLLLTICCSCCFLAFWLWAPCVHAQAQSSTPWFSVTHGSITCRATKINQTPIRVSYYCGNPYGATAGSYTADPTNGGTAVDVITFSLNSTANPPNVVADGFSCSIGVNATSSAVTLGVLGSIPANGASYACGGITGSTITWP